VVWRAGDHRLQGEEEGSGLKKMRSDINLEQFQKRSDIASLGVVAAHVTFVLAPIYLAAAIGPSILLVLLWLCFGLTAQGLLNLMHECAHYHVFRKRWGSDLLGQWVLAPLLVADFDNYRQLHWAHHRNLGATADPKYSYKVDIRGWRTPLFLLRCLIGFEAIKKFLYQNRERARKDLSPSHFWIVRLIVFHGVLLASLFAIAWRFAPHDAGSAILRIAISYAFVYIYGLVSLTLFAATLRAIAEHQNGADDPEVSGEAVLRNLTCGPVGRLIFGCYGFAEHATHHLNPALPGYHLRNATSELAIQSPWLKPQVSYTDVLLDRLRAN
jgi:fatty acid desaturase